MPEPAQLYALAIFYLVLHAPDLTARAAEVSICCGACGATWPCEPVRLAFRLREGF
ncbi:hypothetical protein AB5J62_29895 [Amycolatopsis sp. cg5]|uniref:hypothetical protein n=1 Tax=Amycolatopsis sp. cg5 TaxID=3238802 RepID=UPI003523EB9E